METGRNRQRRCVSHFLIESKRSALIGRRRIGPRRPRAPAFRCLFVCLFVDLVDLVDLVCLFWRCVGPALCERHPPRFAFVGHVQERRLVTELLAECQGYCRLLRDGPLILAELRPVVLGCRRLRWIRTIVTGFYWVFLGCTHHVSFRVLLHVTEWIRMGWNGMKRARMG